MWLEGYFYWCGVIINACLAIGFLIGLGFSVHSWIEEIRYWKGRGKSNGLDEQGDTPKEEIGERYRQY